MRIRAAVSVDHPEELGRPRWQATRQLPESRRLSLSAADFQLLLSEAAARWLLSMLAAILAPDTEPEDSSSPPPPPAGSSAEDPRVRVQVAVHAYNPSEVGRPRWDHEDLVVGIGGVVMAFSEPAARALMDRLACAVTAG